MYTRRLLPSLLVASAASLSVMVATSAYEVRPEVANLAKKVGFVEVDGEPVYLDIAWPKRQDGPFPVVVFLHGGAWSQEGGAFREEIVEASGRGYVALRVNYRLLESDADGIVRHRFPAQLDDVRQALVWLREHRDEFSADMERVALVGASAGGHLALLAGLPDRTLQEADRTLQEEATPKVVIRIKAIVDMYAPVDLLDSWNERPRQRPLLEALLGGSPEENPATYRDASPIHMPNRRSPPVLILHGKLDRRVPVEQSEQLAGKLRDAGVEHELVVLEFERHGFSAAARDQVNNLMYQFLNKHCALDKHGALDSNSVGDVLGRLAR